MPPPYRESAVADSRRVKDKRSNSKMKKIIHIPKGGMPVWQLPVEPDSRTHAVLRVIMFSLMGLIYVTLMVLHILHVIQISMLGMTLLATAFTFSIPAIEYLIRPDKGVTWLLTILLLPVLIIMPITIFLLIVVLPVGLMITQVLNTKKRKKSWPTSELRKHMCNR